LKNISRQVIISVIIGVVIYFALTIYGDIGPVMQAFRTFNWLFIPLLLSLTMVNYIFRFVKWHYYLHLLNIKAEKKLSALIFFSGLIMSVTPMKAGELLKSYLLKQTLDEPISKTAPIIFAERVTDFIALIIVGALGGFAYNYGIKLIVVVFIFFASIVIIISNRALCLWFFSKIEKISFFNKYSQKLYNLYESSYIMLKIKPLLLMIFVSLISWFFECLGVFIILYSFNQNISLFMSSFIYAFSTIFGAVTMLPGGLGVTEGSLTFLIMQNGFAKESAIASTLIIRVVTLWFAVFVGIVSMYLFQKKYGSLITNGQAKGEVK
jgi:glycosyltransferase 2 family protein